MSRYEQSYSGERRTEGLRVQLTPSERLRLQADAALTGARLSSYIRELCLRRTQPIVAGTRRNPEAKALLTELRAIGNNLNQLAHHANATGGNIERKHLAEAISSLKEAMARVIAL